MTGYILSPRAQRDLEEIWNYSAAHWDRTQAESYIRQIQRALEMLAADPRLGRVCDDIRVGYRKYPAGSHWLFYRMIEDGVDVIRILHQRMNFDQHL